MQVDGLHAGIQQQTRYKHNINGSIVQFNIADRSPSCHGDRRRQQVDRHWRLRQVGGRTVSARSVLLRPVAVDTARLLAAQKLQSAEPAPVLPGRGGGSRLDRPRGRCVAAGAGADATAPRRVRRPPKRRRVPQRVCQATTRLAFPLFSFVRVMQMEVLQRSRR